MIVAQNQQQSNLINVLFERGLKNNVPDLQLVDKECISNYEPKCKVNTWYSIIKSNILVKTRNLTIYENFPDIDKNKTDFVF